MEGRLFRASVNFEISVDLNFPAKAQSDGLSAASDPRKISPFGRNDNCFSLATFASFARDISPHFEFEKLRVPTGDKFIALSSPSAQSKFLESELRALRLFDAAQSTLCGRKAEKFFGL